MSRVREAVRHLGKSGIAFLIALALYFLFYFTGHGGLLVLDILILIPLLAIVSFRALRFIKRRSLWSLRNRLLVVYGLIGVLPVLLLFVLIGLGAWALMNELAIYLASSALDRHLGSVNAAVDALRRMPEDQRSAAAPQIVRAFSHALPGMALYLNDANGRRRYPPEAANLEIPPGWNNVDGLLALNGRFYAWAHYRDDATEIAALAPLSNEMVENLVPHLGAIALLETHELRRQDTSRASAGSRTLPGRLNLPPAVNRLDVPLFIPSTRAHFHLDSPNQSFEGVLSVYSRPSAVLRSFFSGSEIIRSVVFDALVAIAVLFLLVELVAIVIGVSLSRRMTRAVNQLYEGTRRVIYGDLRQRIPVRDHDQLGELAESFNQMTGHLERLLEVEKEKERMQTELEIAREVQSQLYPKEAPPSRGLKLSVCCEPARMVSGDYYDYEVLADGKVAFAIGDVAGKGISAALLMATLQSALRSQIAQYQPTRETECAHVPELDAAAVVSKLNLQIYAHTAPEKFATLFFALFDEKSRTLIYTNAGHLSPLLFRNGDVVPLDSNGTVVGAFPFSKYDESCLIMDPGDLLVCYTDGITEPENAFGEMFGEQRLIELVKKHSQRDDREIAQLIVDAVRSWTATPELHDDMTLLLAREVQPV